MTKFLTKKTVSGQLTIGDDVAGTDLCRQELAEVEVGQLEVARLDDVRVGAPTVRFVRQTIPRLPGSKQNQRQLIFRFQENLKDYSNQKSYLLTTSSY